MILTVNRAAFCDAFKTAMSASKATELKKINGVYLAADAERKTVELTGTDIITTVIKRMKDVQVNIGGEVIVPAVVFEILRHSKEESVTLETDENNALSL